MRAIIAAIIVVAWAGSAVAELESGPLDYFDMTHLETTSTTVSVYTVPRKEVNAACNRISVELGRGRFSNPVEGCAFWEKHNNRDYCHIIVGDQSNNDILGHEFRHCVQGQFH